MGNKPSNRNGGKMASPRAAKVRSVRAGAKAVAKAVSSKSDVERVILSEDLIPSHYDLTIETNIKGNFHFDGNVKITFDVKTASHHKITLNAKEIHITKATFKGAGSNQTLEMRKVTYDLEMDTATIHFKFKLPKGEGVLDIDYVGSHNDQMAGFYRSEYKDREGQMATMVSTQFEALDARRCFPCVDEPNRKATFRPTLIVDDGLTALSNMPVESDELMDDGLRRKVVFGTTPRMSTYLLAFAVGDFDFIERESKHGVLIRVYTPPNNSHLGEFSLDVAVDTLDLYDDFFQVPYPLPKLDMIAIPAFAMGAMENWGLVTYREVDLLIDSVRASKQQKQRVASVVAHELAHQWFGNLVTMDWWDGLWLNEGFASWMQNYCLDNLFPEWSIWEQFVTEDQAGALRLDALLSSHPIQVPIKHAKEVEEVFDAISYLKGASVVRLIYSYLGHENFQKGLQTYMAKHKYSNALTNQLWQAWADVSGMPVRDVMATWTEQMGYPVVTVTKVEWAEDLSKATLSLEQKWFIADGSNKPEQKNKLWSIPLMATMGDNDGELIHLGVMSDRKMKVDVELPKGRKTWIKLNGQQHVPMRVNYEPVAEEFTALFSDAILSKDMIANDRAGLLLDSYALTKAGSVDPGSLITLLSAFQKEDTMPVYSAMEEVLIGLKKIVQNSSPELSARFKQFGASIIKETADRLGWDSQEDDGHLTALLRSIVVRLTAAFLADDADVQKNAIERFEKYAEDPVNNHAQLSSDIKTSVVRIVLGSTDDADYYEKCLELIDLADTTQAKKELYLAMGAAKSMDLKKRTLDWCTSGVLKKQDFFYAIGSVSASGKDGLDLTWTYLQENFDRIVDMIRTASPSLLAATVLNSCGSFASNDKADEIEKFFEAHKNEHPVPLIKRKVDQIIEGTRASAKFLKFIEESKTFEQNLDKKGML